MKNFFRDLIFYKDKEKHSFSLPEEEEKNAYIPEKTKKVFSSVSVNLDYIKTVYNIPTNSDVTVREFTLTARGKEFAAFIIYIEGMIDSSAANDVVLKSLMMKNISNTDKSNVVSSAITNNITVRKVKKFDLKDYILKSLIPGASIQDKTSFNELIQDINSGNCILFVDGLTSAFSIDIKGFPHRGISTPQNEIVIQGSSEAFVEVLRVNTSILRRVVNNENLVIENVSIGRISRTACAFAYIRTIANDALIDEVRFRLNNLSIDYLISTGQLEQMIEDSSGVTVPQVISTERPDKATTYLLEGRVVIIVNGNPYCLVVPGTFTDFLASPEDMNLRFQYSNMLKFVRLVAYFIALLLPGIYIAITNFHHELIPTELLFAIAASREAVPFPAIAEILIMEFSFELVREASLRIPSPIGSTLGIIGSLILGQAAVAANIISPILIIVVAITGISSFAMPNFSFGFNIRVLRFAYTILGAVLGFLGIGIGLFLNIAFLTSLTSFGVPYLAPYSPVTNNANPFFLLPIFKREKRADFLNTKRVRKEEEISLDWRFKKNGET